MVRKKSPRNLNNFAREKQKYAIGEECDANEYMMKLPIFYLFHVQWTLNSSIFIVFQLMGCNVRGN